MARVKAQCFVIGSWALAVGVVVVLVGAGGGCGGSSGGTSGASGTGMSRGGTGGASGTGVARGGAGGASGTGGSQGAAGRAGSGSGGDAGAAGTVDAGLDGGNSDAAVCSPDNYLFDCPEHFACDSNTLRCTTKCSNTQPCRGGCCKGGTCQPGTEANACGHDGMSCSSCSAVLDDGPLCLAWPYTDSPTRPGGYCGCMTATDCTSSRNMCQPELTLTRRCCAPANASCSTTYPRDCCSGVCAAGTCG